MSEPRWPEQAEWPGEMGQELTREEVMGWNAAIRRCRNAFLIWKKEQRELVQGEGSFTVDEAIEFILNESLGIKGSNFEQCLRKIEELREKAWRYDELSK